MKRRCDCWIDCESRSQIPCKYSPDYALYHVAMLEKVRQQCQLSWPAAGGSTRATLAQHMCPDLFRDLAITFILIFSIYSHNLSGFGRIGLEKRSAMKNLFSKARTGFRSDVVSENPQGPVQEWFRSIQSPSLADVTRYRYHNGTNIGSIFIIERWLTPSMYHESAKGSSELAAVEYVKVTRSTFRRIGTSSSESEKPNSFRDRSLSLGRLLTSLLFDLGLGSSMKALRRHDRNLRNTGRSTSVMPTWTGLEMRSVRPSDCRSDTLHLGRLIASERLSKKYLPSIKMPGMLSRSL